MKVIQHSAETLRTALISDSKDVAKIYSKYSKEERRLLEEGLHPGKPGSLFQPITLHSESDWILAHPEEPQDFKNFYRDPYRRTPNAGHNSIYIQTIGESDCVVSCLSCGGVRMWYCSNVSTLYCHFLLITIRNEHEYVCLFIISLVLSASDDTFWPLQWLVLC